MTDQPNPSEDSDLIPESEREMSKLEETESGEGLPEELPPVEPPSAAFIMQLFLIPALIVIFIVGIWALFGKIASGEQDWKTLVVELRSENEQRRWRAATSLAYLLNADEKRGALGQNLANNQEIATELSGLVDEKLKRTTFKPEEIQHISFVLRAMGGLNELGVVLPTMTQAMKPGNDREIRKEAITSVARIAGRGENATEILNDKELVNQLIETTRDEDPLFRQVSSYTLGLIPSKETSNQLEIMLGDSDLNTRVNAAIGLARQHSIKAYPVLKETIESYKDYADFQVIDPAVTDEENEKNSQYLVHLVSLKNCIKSIDDIAKELSDEQKKEMISLLTTISNEHSQAQITDVAKKSLKNLSESQ